MKQNENMTTLPLEMRVNRLDTQGGSCLAHLSMTLGECFAVRGIRLMEGKNGPFLSFPSYKAKDGYQDICFPLNGELRRQMTEAAVDAYNGTPAQPQTQPMGAARRDPRRGESPGVCRQAQFSRCPLLGGREEYQALQSRKTRPVLCSSMESQPKAGLIHTRTGRRKAMDRSERIIHRGEIYYADLNPVVGSEQGGIRPVLILQNEVGNWFSPTVIVAAMTAKGSKVHLPTHVPVGTDSGLRRPSIVLAEQVRTIDKSRLLERVGTLSPEKQGQVDRALRISFALSPQREEEPEWTQEESSITMGCSGF